MLRAMAHFSISLLLSYLPNLWFPIPIAYQNDFLSPEYFAQLLQSDLMQVT